MDEHNNWVRAAPFRQLKVTDKGERSRVEGDFLIPEILRLPCTGGDECQGNNPQQSN
jgi:hypothetical protein